MTAAPRPPREPRIPSVNPFTAESTISRPREEVFEYLAGLPGGAGSIGANQLWYGVFLWAKNQTNRPSLSASRFDIIDSTGGRYFPVPLNAELNAYAWTPQHLPPSGIQPLANTTAYYGPTGGNLLLFKLPTSVYSNRPLTLQIYASGSSKPSQISLDL